MLTWVQNGISMMLLELEAMCSGGKEFLFALGFPPSAFANSLLWNFKELSSLFCFQAAKYEKEKLPLFYKNVVMFYKLMLRKGKYFKIWGRNLQFNVKCYQHVNGEVTFRTRSKHGGWRLLRGMPPRWALLVHREAQIHLYICTL